MVLHVLLLAKLPLIHLFKLSPLLWPFNLYVPLARELPRVCITISSASRLFAFRLQQIVAAESEGRQRFERTVRLVCDQLSVRPPAGAPFNARYPRGQYSVPALLALSL